MNDKPPTWCPHYGFCLKTASQDFTNKISWCWGVCPSPQDFGLPAPDKFLYCQCNHETDEIQIEAVSEYEAQLRATGYGLSLLKIQEYDEKARHENDEEGIDIMIAEVKQGVDQLLKERDEKYIQLLYKRQRDMR